ncbi:YtxH domain-containing protein [Planococcus sp. ISL-109]|uniref:YtxH domain-containing protein n=1 Tax=Planococcus sp. ISL-109 TaxID=2819166 RepID=UPI001BE6B793|nr:YtxH domain-containing protein [Planococcus sp. ISL-109]MBT2583747.1 YtxH domain-containing protein [Planococcus sp. ISL-109]
MKVSNFFAGLAAGLAAGAATAILSAPKSGKDMRSSIKSSGSEWKHSMNELKARINELKESINLLTEESKTQVPEAVDGLKASLQSWQEETAPAKEHLQLEIQAIQNSIEQLQATISKNKDDEDKKTEKPTAIDPKKADDKKDSETA